MTQGPLKPAQPYLHIFHHETQFQHRSTPLAKSALYELRDSPNAGRGVFAAVDLSPGIHLMTTTADSFGKEPGDFHTTNSNPVSRDGNCEPSTPDTDTTLSNFARRRSQLEPLSPLAWLIQRPYRKEVCAECFIYDRGREWRVKAQYPDDRDGSIAGIVFCSETCRGAWILRNGNPGVEAWTALGDGIQQVTKQGRNKHEDTMMNPLPASHGPSDDDVLEAWAGAGRVGEVVITARMKEKPSKNERKVVKKVIEDGGDPDLMYYILTAVLSAYNATKRLTNDQRDSKTAQTQLECGSKPASRLDRLTTIQEPTPVCSTSTSTSSSIPLSPSDSINSNPNIDPFPLPALLTLTSSPSSHAYRYTHTSLHAYTTSHLYLLTILPLPLLPLLTPSLSHNLNTRAAHNAFSIRPTDASDYDNECLGWGVWPEASFWNHSCRPNVLKRRCGRCWEFTVAKDVERSEELCVSYLGGEEKTLDVKERRERLVDEWGFVCMCVGCVEEEKEACGM